MINKGIILGIIIFLIGQVLIWYQTNLQFLSSWAKNNTFLLSLIGVPISYVFIYAHRYIVYGFEGKLWPSRLIGFSLGMLVMSILTYTHMGQGINLKTGITLILAFLILGIQLFWK